MNLINALKPQLIKKATRNAEKELNEEIKHIFIYTDIKGNISQLKIVGIKGKRIERFIDTGGNTDIFLGLIKKEIGEKYIKEIFFIDTKIFPFENKILFDISYINLENEKIKTSIEI